MTRIGLARVATSVVAGLTAFGLALPAAAPAMAADHPNPGSAGLGDRLYPTLGNGGYQVLHYDLNLRYPSAAPSSPLTGTATIAAVATQALSRFDLDFAGDSVGAVAVNGRPATAVRDGEELVVTPARPLHRGQPFLVTVIDFRATPIVPDPNGFLSAAFISTPDGTAWAGQPNGSHQVFPSNDHPSDKASFSFRIDVPAGTSAVANGRYAGSRTERGRTIWRYEQPQPMATELAQVAVGAYTVTRRGTPHGVTVRDVTPTRLTAELAPKLAVEAGQLDWMRAKVGSYPFDSYGSLVVDSPLGFALETQTLSLYDTPWFRYYPQGLWDPVMLHELAHQWFGDSVAPAQWSDVWLNEGHATWYETTYAAEKGFLPDDAGASDFTELMRTIYSLGDQWRAQLGPVAAPLSGDVYDLFNSNVYYGGALALYALRQQIGDAAFQRLERAWVTVYRGRSASTADFIRLASRVSGQDLRPFLATWLYGATTPPMPGHPDWTVDPVAAPSAAAVRASSVAVPMKGLRVHQRR
jgi:aminopeptidase N